MSTAAYRRVTSPLWSAPLGISAACVLLTLPLPALIFGPVGATWPSWLQGIVLLLPASILALTAELMRQRQGRLRRERLHELMRADGWSVTLPGDESSHRLYREHLEPASDALGLRVGIHGLRWVATRAGEAGTWVLWEYAYDLNRWRRETQRTIATLLPDETPLPQGLPATSLHRGWHHPVNPTAPKLSEPDLLPGWQARGEPDLLPALVGDEARQRQLKRAPRGEAWVRIGDRTYGSVDVLDVKNFRPFVAHLEAVLAPAMRR